MNTCIVPDCPDPKYSNKGYCNKHRMRVRRTGSTERVRGAEYPYCGLWKHRAWSKQYLTTNNGGWRRRKGRKAFVHILVAEYHLGRKLLPDEVVHHIDNNGLNNRRENLVVMKRSEHYKPGVHTVAEPF